MSLLAAFSQGRRITPPDRRCFSPRHRSSKAADGACWPFGPDHNRLQMRSGTTHLQIKVQEEPRMTNRRNNNVVEFPAGRQRAISEEPSVRTAQRSAERFREANDLLEKLRSRKERIIYEDRRILASNLGRQITDLDLANRDTLTKDLLGDNRYQHRTRYVRFPDEPHDGRYAASAGDIAKIITKIIEKKVSQGRDHAQATVDSVHDALRGTSFLPPSR